MNEAAPFHLPIEEVSSLCKPMPRLQREAKAIEKRRLGAAKGMRL